MEMSEEAMSQLMQGGVPPGMMAPPGMGMPSAAAQQVTRDQIKDWTTLYPCYLDAALKVSQGRRLPLHKLVGCNEVFVQDLAEGCARLGFKCAIEGDKRHPSHPFSMGRARVQMKNKDGSAVVPDIASKEALLNKLAEVIPTLQGRHMRLAMVARERAAMAAAAAKAAPPAAAPAVADAPAPAAAGGRRRKR